MTGVNGENKPRLLRSGKGPQVLPRSGWTAPLTTFCAGVMAFLAVLTLAASFAADAVAEQWRADLSGVATVRLSTRDGDADARLKAVLEVLRTTPGISRVRVLSDTEQIALLEPWLGDGAGLEGLPAPQMIDVRLIGAGPDADALQARLDLTVSGVVYDDHAAWRAPLAAAAEALETMAIAASILVLLTVGAIVAFAARATLVANRHVVETVRLVGGEDQFIERAFVRRLMARAAAGAGAGAVVGTLAIFLLPDVDARDPALALALSPSILQWAIMLIGVPLLSVLVTWAAARAAVRLTLRAMP
ncbi:MAG: cell division protein FtsX [Paracoccaceae bacterium]